MRKKMVTRISSLLLSAAMVLGVSVTAFAATPTVTLKGKDDFEVTSKNIFVDFNAVMPGDTLTQQVVFENKARDCDYVHVYLRAVPKSEADNTSIQQEFLSQLKLTVKNGTSEIYQDSPEDPGTLRSGVFLGSLRRNQKVTLDLTLEVPIELDNRYADCISNAVDWIFSVSCFDDTTPGGGGDPTPEDDPNSPSPDYDDGPRRNRPTTTTIEDGEVPLTDLPPETVTIEDGEVPLKDMPNTGDMIPVAAIAAALVSLCGIIVLDRKRK